MRELNKAIDSSSDGSGDDDSYTDSDADAKPAKGKQDAKKKKSHSKDLSKAQSEEKKKQREAEVKKFMKEKMGIEDDDSDEEISGLDDFDVNSVDDSQDDKKVSVDWYALIG